MKLYELAEEYRDFESKLDLFLEMIERGEMDEQTFDDTLALIETSLEDKLDAVACTVKNMESEAEAMRAEELRLAKRRKASRLSLQYYDEPWKDQGGNAA